MSGRNHTAGINQGVNSVNHAANEVDQRIHQYISRCGLNPPADVHDLQDEIQEDYLAVELGMLCPC